MIKENIGWYGLAATCPGGIGQVLRILILAHLNVWVLNIADYLLLLLVRDLLRHHYSYLIAFTAQFRNQELNFQQESNYDSDLELYLTCKPKWGETVPCRIPSFSLQHPVRTNLCSFPPLITKFSFLASGLDYPGIFCLKKSIETFFFKEKTELH